MCDLRSQLAAYRPPSRGSSRRPATRRNLGGDGGVELDMLTRRDVVRDLAGLTAGIGAAPLLVACGRRVGGGGDAGPDEASFSLVAAKVKREKGSAAAVPDGVATVRALTGDLYRRLASAPGNIVVSPYSVAVALAMTRHGAIGATASEMDAVLHAPSLPRLGAGMNALGQLLDGRAGEVTPPDRTKGTVSLQTANSLWGQRGMTWQPSFLEALGRDFGSGMRLVDYIMQVEAARQAINDWTAAQTRGRIPQIVPPAPSTTPPGSCWSTPSTSRRPG